MIFWHIDSCLFHSDSRTKWHLVKLKITIMINVKKNTNPLLCMTCLGKWNDQLNFTFILWYNHCQVQMTFSIRTWRSHCIRISTRQKYMCGWLLNIEHFDIISWAMTFFFLLLKRLQCSIIIVVDSIIKSYSVQRIWLPE